jgi:hypothetical protein
MRQTQSPAHAQPIVPGSNLDRHSRPNAFRTSADDGDFTVKRLRFLRHEGSVALFEKQ